MPVEAMPTYIGFVGADRVLVGSVLESFCISSIREMLLRLAPSSKLSGRIMPPPPPVPAPPALMLVAAVPALGMEVVEPFSVTRPTRICVHQSRRHQYLRDEGQLFFGMTYRSSCNFEAVHALKSLLGICKHTVPRQAATGQQSA